ncbi:MAG: hypothetical protein LKE36_06320 [Bacilli bacterium]|jgi:hypothetical protein|nr:hypothetical protein [Bacilli bacterium]
MELIGYKSKKGALIYSLALVVLVVIFFLVTGLISISSNADVFTEMTLWLVLMGVVFIWFILMLFSYILLPRVLLLFQDKIITIYSLFKRSKKIDLNEIVSISILPSILPFHPRSTNLVITTKGEGSFVISYLKDINQVSSFLNKKLENHIISNSDQYFSSSDYKR